jgi:aspartyl-tRNA(Asn)/glutamyl-tRNA(Gln) amidotransferase subunit C
VKITVEDVEHVAVLARLRLTDEEKTSYATQLSAILEYFDKLSEVDTDQVEPMSHPIDLENVFRPDRAAESMPPETILANAPDRAEDCFRVPLVLDHDDAGPEAT